MGRGEESFVSVRCCARTASLYLGIYSKCLWNYIRGIMEYWWLEIVLWHHGIKKTSKTPIGGLRCGDCGGHRIGFTVSLHLLNHSATAVAMLMGAGIILSLIASWLSMWPLKANYCKEETTTVFYQRKLELHRLELLTTGIVSILILCTLNISKLIK